MDRINGADTIDIGGGRRGFRDENLAAGAAGTEVTALHLNSIQEEILKVITEAGLVPSDADWTQLWQALQILGLASGSRSRRWVAVMSMTLSSAPGAPASGDTYLVPVGATGIWAANAGKIAQWTGSSWSYLTPPDGHGISLPDGRVFERIAGTYVEKLALDAQSGKWNYAAIAGTADALTMTLAPAPASWAALIGAPIRGIISTTNTGAATLNVNGLGAKPIVASGANALLKGQLLAGTAVTFVYDGTNVQVSTPLAVRFATDVTVYNTAGSGTYIVPAGVTRILVEIWGGGGGGGGASNMANEYCGTGGAGGGYTRKIIDVTPGQTLPYTVGAAGTSGAAGSSGTTGGTTSFGGILSATGGSPGVHGKFAVIGNITAGGVGTGGDINLIGGFGTGALPAAPNGTGVGGGGGGTPFGAPSGVQSAGPNIAGVWPGGGGGGSGGTGGAAGGAGAVGGIIIQIIN